MKNLVVRFLRWALNKLEPAPVWDFPPVSEDFDPRPKTKPRVKKATTRPVKKAPAAARTTAKKAKQ